MNAVRRRGEPGQFSERNKRGERAARLDAQANGATHKVVMDGAEKLLFGYDQAGVPTTYER